MEDMSAAAATVGGHSSRGFGIRSSLLPFRFRKQERPDLQQPQTGSEELLCEVGNCQTQHRPKHPLDQGELAGDFRVEMVEPVRQVLDVVWSRHLRSLRSHR